MCSLLHSGRQPITFIGLKGGALWTTFTDLCEVGKLIAIKCDNVCVLANGDCTELYYHLLSCDECEKLRLGTGVANLLF